MHEEFETGYEGLHPKHTRLFTLYSLADRKKFKDQSNVSWLLRVESAQRVAATHPFTEQELERLEQQKQQARATEKTAQNELHMRTLLATWLGRDQHESIND